MSAAQPANMKTPQVLLLLLLTTLTWTASCQDEDAEMKEDNAGDSGDMETTEDLLVPPSTTSAPGASTTLTTVPADENVDSENGSGLRSFIGNSDDLETTEDPNFKDPTTTNNEVDSLDLIIILIPSVLVVVIIAMTVCGVVVCRRSSHTAKHEELRKEDSYLDGSCTEKVPMPMFEEDVPSVLELEMEELDQWMKKDCETPGESLSKQS